MLPFAATAEPRCQVKKPKRQDKDESWKIHQVHAPVCSSAAANPALGMCPRVSRFGLRTAPLCCRMYFPIPKKAWTGQMQAFFSNGRVRRVPLREDTSGDEKRHETRYKVRCVAQIGVAPRKCVMCAAGSTGGSGGDKYIFSRDMFRI